MILGWPRAGTAATVVGVCAFAGACDAPGAPEVTFVVRDSAGVRIVESFAPVWGAEEGWTIGAEPALHIGVVEGAPEYQFSTVAGVWRREDGRIVVADSRSAEVRTYGPGGDFLGSFGRSGEGPGEFPTITQARVYRGDSILVWRAGGRMAVFDADGRLGRSQTLVLPEPPTQGTGSMGLMGMGGLSEPFADGSLLVSPGLRLQGERGEAVSYTTTLLRLSPRGDSVGAVGPPRANTIAFPPPPDQVLAPSPFSAPLAYGVYGSRLYLGDPPDFQFDVIAADGSVEGILRASHLDLAVTEAARDAYRTRQRESEAGRRDPAGMERALQAVEFPATLPPFSQALVDGLDHLWVRHYRLPGAVGPEVWSVFHPEGHLLGLVETPERLQVRQIGPDFVLGIWTDELDVRHIRLYGMERD